MLTKYGSILTIAEVSGFKKLATKFPHFIENNETAMKRLAAIQPIVLNPEKFLYMRTRMVSAVEKHGPNANGDAFEHMELAAKYPTFINAAVNIDHDNDHPDKAVGIVLDARYVPEQMYVEGVHAIDRERAEAKRPGIIAMIENGVVKDTSMGCYVEASICSHCLKEAGWDGAWDINNPEGVNKYISGLKRGAGIATIPEEYCRHIGRFGEKKGGMNGPYEVNRGVNFFEDSIITTAGADKDAKYIERLARVKSLDWMKYVVRRELVNGGITTASLNLKGAEDMKPEKIAEEGSKMGEEKNVSVVDKKNYSDAEDKDKDLAQEAKKPAPKDDGMGGSQVSSADEKPNYALAQLEAIATVKEMAKTNPEIIAELMKASEEGEKEEKKEDKMKKEESVKPEVKKAEEKKKPTLLARLIATVGLKTLLEAAMQGNQTDSMEEKPDYGSGSGKDDDEFSQSVGKSESEAGKMRGSQLMSAEERADYSLQKRGGKNIKADGDIHLHKHEHNEGGKPEDKVEPKPEMAPKPEPVMAEQPKATTMEADGGGGTEHSQRMSALIVERMAAGETLDQARETVAQMEQGQSRKARRERLADDLNHGSMGSPGLPEKDGEGAETPGDKLKDFHKKVEEPVSQHLETMEEKTVGAAEKKADTSGPTPVEPKLDEGNIEKLDNEEIRKDNGRKVGSKKEAEDKDEIHADEAPESPTQKDMTGPHGVEKEGNTWRAPWSSVTKTKEGSVMVWGEKSSDEAKKLVDNMDEKTAGLRDLIAVKTERAQVMASAGYKKDSAYHLMGIEKLERHASKLEDIANRIANLVEAVDKLDVKQASLREAATDNLLTLVKSADDEMKETKKDLDGMKDGDMKKEESYAVAKRQADLESKNRQLQAQVETSQQKVLSMVKTRLVNDMLKLGARKGVITAANKDRMIQKLSSMPEVQFEATKTAWVELPDAQVKTAAKEEVPSHLGTLSPKREVTAGVEGDVLDDPYLFGKW